MAKAVEGGKARVLVRYMIDYVYDAGRLKRGENPYVPCGVWAMSDTQFEIGVLEDRFPEREDEVRWFINDVVEQGIDPVRVPGFLEYWRERRSTYNGSYSEIVQTERYASVLQCAETVLEHITVATPDQNPR